MTEGSDHKANKAMGKMEETLSDLQDDLAVASTPPANHFKPMWLLVTIIVVLLVGGATFLAVRALTQVPENARAIDKNCEQRNRQLATVNEKFAQLNTLIEAALRDTDEPISADVLAAFEDLRKPIPTVTCTSLSMGAP